MTQNKGDDFLEDKIKVIMNGEVSFKFSTSDIGKASNLNDMDNMIEHFNESFYQLLEENFLNLEDDFVKISKFEMTREIEEVEEI